MLRGEVGQPARGGQHRAARAQRPRGLGEPGGIGPERVVGGERVRMQEEDVVQRRDARHAEDARGPVAAFARGARELVQVHEAHPLRPQPRREDVRRASRERVEPASGRILDHVGAVARMPDELRPRDGAHDVAHVPVDAAAEEARDVKDRGWCHRGSAKRNGRMMPESAAHPFAPRPVPPRRRLPLGRRLVSLSPARRRGPRRRVGLGAHLRRGARRGVGHLLLATGATCGARRGPASRWGSPSAGATSRT